MIHLGSVRLLYDEVCLIQIYVRVFESRISTQSFLRRAASVAKQRLEMLSRWVDD